MPLSLKIIEVILLSTVKFFFSIPLSLGLGFSYWQTILLTTSGGITGTIIFYFLTPLVVRIINFIYHGIRRLLGLRDKRHQPKRKRKKFTRRNKNIIKIRGSMGMFGVVAFTPVFLSIPLGSILANKYYGNHRFILFFLCLSVACWSVMVTSAFYFNTLWMAVPRA